MADPRIPVAGPWVTDLEREYVAKASLEDWYANAGQSVGQFEREFAAYVGVEHAAAVSHCTSALHLSLLALGIGPGDEVIVPEATWVATAVPILYVGATPVFVDIDPESWCISPEALKACVTERTRAIMTVDLYGAVPDMDAIGAVAAQLGIPIIEDAAQAVGSTWNGALAGSLGDVATFSFHGTKTLTTGEGGMLVTDRSDIIDRVLRLRDHGRSAADFKFFVTSELGYKYRMSSLQAAFGRAQLMRIDELLGRKREIFQWYRQRLADLPGVRMNAAAPACGNSFWMTTVVVDAALGLGTREMMSRFDEAGIDTRPFFPPLSSLPLFTDHAEATKAAVRNKVAYDIAQRSVNLPSAMILTEDDVDRVCGVLRDMVRR